MRKSVDKVDVRGGMLIIDGTDENGQRMSYGFTLDGIAALSNLVNNSTPAPEPIKGKTIDKIITQVDTRRGAPMGRHNVGELPKDKRIYDCRVPMCADGAYDRGGVYWGLGPELRVKYTKDLSYIEFYRNE